MKQILKSTLALSLLVGTAAQAKDIHVKFSVVDWKSYQPMDWQSGWSSIDLYAVGPDGSTYYPADDRETNSFVFPASGLYTFHGKGRYVCGLNQGQEIHISPNIVEIRLFGWCE